MPFRRRISSSSSEERGRPRFRESFPIMEENHRTNSISSDFSVPESTPSTSPPKSSGTWFKPTPQAKNVYTTCGRHTNQLLFSGPSLAEMARSLLRKD